MKEQLARLYDLQVIDSDLAQHRAWIADLDDGTKTGQKLAAAQGDFDAKSKRLRDLEATNRAKELELKSADEDRTARAKRAYSGSVADAKELSALERKIEELDRKRDHLADDLLTLMEQIETAREEAAKAERLVKLTQGVCDQTRKDYAEARAKLEGEMKQSLAKRQELAPQIDPNLLKEYDALRAKLDGVAVAGVDGNLCKACKNVVPQSSLSQMKVGKVLVKCDNCRRILFPSEAW
jgi:uncharacterized protein